MNGYVIGLVILIVLVACSFCSSLCDLGYRL